MLTYFQNLGTFKCSSLFLITALSFAQRIDNFKKLNPIISKTFSRYRKLMLKQYVKELLQFCFCVKNPLRFNCCCRVQI